MSTGPITVSTPTVTSSNGVFVVTGSDGKSRAVDMGTLMMMVNVEYVDLMDVQLEIQIEVMENRNFEIQAATEVMSRLRTAKSNGESPDNIIVTVGDTKKTIKEWCSYLGISYTEGVGSRPGSDSDKQNTWDSKVEANIQNIKSAIDLLNNDSQIDSIRLQDLMEKRSDALEKASNLMSSRNDALESLNRNL